LSGVILDSWIGPGALLAESMGVERSAWTGICPRFELMVPIMLKGCPPTRIITERNAMNGVATKSARRSKIEPSAF
jgi:hypothetical protein